MGKQVNLFLHPRDIEDLEEELREKSRLTFISGKNSAPRVEELGHLGDGRWLQVFLSRPEDIEAVQLIEVSHQGYWVIDSLKSPVVEFLRPYFDGRILRRGRLFYDEGFYGNDGSWIDKPASFRAWAESILSVARGLGEKSSRYGAYVGRHAHDWQRKTKGEFVSL